MDARKTTPKRAAVQAPHRPWFKFHRVQWLGNIKLRACSLEARGLWVDILAATDPDGYVRVTIKAIASLAGITLEQATTLIAELERNGVLHRGTDDLVLVRTISRDHTQALHGRDGGLASLKKRGGSKGALQGSLGGTQGGTHRSALYTLTSSISSDSSLRVGGSSPSESSSLSSERATPGSCPPLSKGGGNPATRAWDEEYLEAVGSPFVWLKSQAKGHAVALAECLDAAGKDIDELRRRIRCLLRSERRWHVERRTPRGLLGCWNDFPPPRPIAPPPAQVQDARVDEVVGRTLGSLLGGSS
jgi:hypothetical protein